MIQRSREVLPSQKAAYAMDDGRVLRQFFGLSPADEQAIGDRLEAGLDEAFKE